MLATIVPGVDEEVLAARHDGHSGVRLLLREWPTCGGGERDTPPPPPFPQMMTTQTLERVSPGKKKKEPSKRPRSALPPACSACAGATCGLATATVCSETRLRMEIFRWRKCLCFVEEAREVDASSSPHMQ